MSWVFKKKNESQQGDTNKNSNQNAGYVDLAKILTDEDRRLLITHLGIIEGVVSPEQRAVVTVTKELVE